PCQSSKTSRRVTSTTEAAKRKVTMRAISSPSAKRARNEREPACGPALGTFVVVVATKESLLDLADRFQFFFDDWLGQLGVGQLLDHVLAIGERPLKEALDGITLGGVGELVGDQQPREAGDRVGSLAGSVGDGDAEIIRHFLNGTRGSRTNSSQIRLHKRARRVLY